MTIYDILTEIICRQNNIQHVCKPGNHLQKNTNHLYINQHDSNTRIILQMKCNKITSCKHIHHMVANIHMKLKFEKDFFK